MQSLAGKSRRVWRTLHYMALLEQQSPISLEELPHFRPVANKSAFFFFVAWNKWEAPDSKALDVEKETQDAIHCKAKMFVARWSSPRATPAQPSVCHPPTATPVMAQSRVSGGKTYLWELQSAPRKPWRSSEEAAAPLGSLDAEEHLDGKKRKIRSGKLKNHLRSTSEPQAVHAPPAPSSAGTYKVQT